MPLSTKHAQFDAVIHVKDFSLSNKYQCHSNCFVYSVVAPHVRSPIAHIAHSAHCDLDLPKAMLANLPNYLPDCFSSESDDAALCRGLRVTESLCSLLVKVVAIGNVVLVIAG